MTIPIPEARDILGYYRPRLPGAVSPGGFGKALISAFDKADMGNFARLEQAFPEYGEVMRRVKHGTGGGMDSVVKAVDEADGRDYDPDWHHHY